MRPSVLPPLVAIAILCASSVRASAAGPILSVRASSVHSDDYPAECAFDGRADTRWASISTSQPQHWDLDLGQVVSIEGITIRWEHACAVEYQIQLSIDGKAWQVVHDEKSGRGGVEKIQNLSNEARFLRIACLKPGPHGLYSIWEVEIHGQAAAAAVAQARRYAERARQQAEARARAALAETLADAGVEEIVFAARHQGGDGHWYANFAYYARQPDRKAYGAPGGRLYRLNLKTGKLTTLLDDPAGSVRDPVVHYDGKRILFSYRKGASGHFNLYEMDADGQNLRQLTSGDWDDIEPAYLPDGGIAFVSSRCKRWVNCWLTQVAVLHRCDADGRNIRPLSSNNEQDNTPWVLPDGRILYQRWEYIDRSQVDYHHLWTMNPDGTNQAVYFGNMHAGTLMIDAKPIPGADRILATFSPGHGQREHEGPFYTVDANGGPDDARRARRFGRASGRDPYPLTSRHVLYAVGRSIRLIASDGADVELYRDPRFDLHEPRPVITREPEQVIPSRINLAEATGRVILADVHIGRNMTGVRRGDIRKLLVIESLPKPINFTGGMDPLTYGGSFTLERIVGTVPVEADGSAHIELPALRSFFFVALDEKDMSVKRMQSFMTVQPGETLSCIGCHEQRTHAVPATPSLLALKRSASRPQPIADQPDVYDFPRDIQPILDRHCVRCHDYDKHPEGSEGPRAGGIILTADRGPMFSHSYYALTIHKQFADGRNEPQGNRAPRTLGSSASPLMKKVLERHQGAMLSPREVDTVRYWIEAGAPYPGTYAALGTGMIGGYYENNLVETDFNWPQTKAATAAIRQRCTSCHQGKLSLPAALSDENSVSFWRPDWNDPRLPRARHAIFNLSRPAKSLALLAPLAKSAGGYEACGQAVFASADDPDYRKILAMIEAGQQRLDKIKRFDMPGFNPDPAYIREMQRYGVLPAILPPNAPIDPYRIDQAYWRSLWWRPAD